MSVKMCSRCQESKSLTEFSQDKKGKFGVTARCKLCSAQYHSDWYEKNREKQKAAARAYARQNADKIKVYKEGKKEHIQKVAKQYREKHREKRKLYHTEYCRNRKEKDSNFKLICNLRIRLLQAIKSKQKTGSAVRDLGCSIPELLEMLDQDCLRKYGELYSTAPKGKYHIDHIRPLVSFNLEDPEQLCQAVHHTNLQVLLAEENLSKGTKVLDIASNPGTV